MGEKDRVVLAISSISAWSCCVQPELPQDLVERLAVGEVEHSAEACRGGTEPDAAERDLEPAAFESGDITNSDTSRQSHTEVGARLGGFELVDIAPCHRATAD